jgi:hypothetical protein
MSELHNDTKSLLNFGGFNQSDYKISNDLEKQILVAKQSAVDRKNGEENPFFPQSGSGNRTNPGTAPRPNGNGESVGEWLGGSKLRELENVRIGDPVVVGSSAPIVAGAAAGVIAGAQPQATDQAPAEPTPEPVDIDADKKLTGSPAIKLPPAAESVAPGLVPGIGGPDPNREAREDRVYDLLFNESAISRFSAGIGYGPFTPQEAMALRFFAARNGERLQELRDLHGEDALRIATRAIIDVLQENAGQMLPQQHIIDASFNAALNFALHPDNLQQEFEAASRNALFGPVYDLVEDSIYTNPTLSRESRNALTRFMAENVDQFIDFAAQVPYAERPALMDTFLQIMRDQGDGPVAYEFFAANLKAAINLFLAQRAASQTPTVPILQQDAQELFREANERARRVLEEANQPLADRTATIREAIEQAAANGDVYLQMALIQLLPPELGDALVPGAVVDPATSTALLNHLRNMRADEAAGVLEALEADPGNVAPEILDALREAVDPRSAMSSDTKLKYDNYIRNGTFSEAQFRNLQRLNPDRSPEEIINFLAIRNQGITLPGFVTREPEPQQIPGESNFGPVGRPTQEELDALRQQLEAESTAIIEDLESGDSALSPEESERAVERATIQGMVAMLITIDPGSMRVLRGIDGSIEGVMAIGIRSASPFHDREPALYVQDLLRVGKTPGVALPLLQAAYREAEALNLPLALRPLNDRVAAYYESLGGQRTESGEMIWRDMPRPVGQ